MLLRGLYALYYKLCTTETTDEYALRLLNEVFYLATLITYDPSPETDFGRKYFNPAVSDFGRDDAMVIFSLLYMALVTRKKPTGGLQFLLARLENGEVGKSACFRTCLTFIEQNANWLKEKPVAYMFEIVEGEDVLFPVECPYEFLIKTDPFKGASMSPRERETRLTELVIQALQQRAGRCNSDEEGKADMPPNTEISPAAPSDIRIAAGRKSDFLRVVQAMLDEGMFVDGNQKVPSAAKVFRCLRSILDEDFKRFRSSLSEAKESPCGDRIFEVLRKRWIAYAGLSKNPNAAEEARAHAEAAKAAEAAKKSQT